MGRESGRVGEVREISEECEFAGVVDGFEEGVPDGLPLWVGDGLVAGIGAPA